MKVFASRFLEEPVSNPNLQVEKWAWKPEKEITEIVASGANTTSRESTYVGEKDNRADDDRPNEGRMLIA